MVQLITCYIYVTSAIYKYDRNINKIYHNISSLIPRKI